MSIKKLLSGIVFFLGMLGTPGTGETVETERLIIRDITANMPSERLDKLVSKVDLTLTEILKFWSSEPRTQELGKIIVEFDSPLPKANSSIFFWRTEGGQKVRVVRVFGGNEYPHLLAHKLTSAVFPNPDKLIRNMMGEASEMRFGNPLSFPMCGFDKDQWLMALMQSGSYIPLTKIGPEHSAWGMEIENNVPKVKNRAKQHASYLEAGSFGEFLINTYGTEKMKQFNLLSRKTPRPWSEVFGRTLEQLETKWLETAKLKSRDKVMNISTLVDLLRDDPNTACFAAQSLASSKK